MHTAPTANSHQMPVRTTMTVPAAAASAKNTSATMSTVRGFAAPEATSRLGPTRCLSVPRMPSE